MATNTRLVHGLPGMSFAFGPFRLFPTQRMLTESDKQVHLGSRAFDILVALLERPGELVRKEDLMARVWPNTFVAPANLTVHISALRRALGDERGHRYVVNTPGRGYHFVAPVTVEKKLPSDSVAAAPTREHNLPAHITEPTGRGEIADGLPQRLQRGRLLALVGRDDIGQPTVDRAVFEKLVGTYGNSVWLVELRPIEES